MRCLAWLMTRRNGDRAFSGRGALGAPAHRSWRDLRVLVGREPGGGGAGGARELAQRHPRLRSPGADLLRVALAAVPLDARAAPLGVEVQSGARRGRAALAGRGDRDATCRGDLIAGWRCLAREICRDPWGRVARIRRNDRLLGGIRSGLQPARVIPAQHVETIACWEESARPALRAPPGRSTSPASAARAPLGAELDVPRPRICELAHELIRRISSAVGITRLRAPMRSSVVSSGRERSSWRMPVSMPPSSPRMIFPGCARASDQSPSASRFSRIASKRAARTASTGRCPGTRGHWRAARLRSFPPARRQERPPAAELRARARLQA
jgi:hypothetical protein